MKREERDRLAVEVQTLREALRDAVGFFEMLSTERGWDMWLSERGRLTNDGESAVAGELGALKDALSAPSESERVLAARDERVRADERAKMTPSNSPIHPLCEQNRDECWLAVLCVDGFEREHLSNARMNAAVAEHDREVRAAALEDVASTADRVAKNGGHLTGDVIRALGATRPSAASAVCPKYPDGKHRFTPYTCACLACIGDVPPSAAIGKETT